MSVPSVGRTVETLAEERANPPFDVRKLSIIQHGSEKDLLLKEKFMLELARDPIFYLGDIHDLTKDELRERTFEKVGSLVYHVTNESIDDFQKRMQVIGLCDPGFWTRFGVHYGLFLGAIRSGATPNQMSYWMEKGVISCQGMYGCFGMTELAHGSNVAGLETTATFDEQADQFVIHTPHIGATKWWIGGAAQTATHCAVFAQLVIKGKKHGTKTFIVPLRNIKTLELLPGINIGDIGKKMGRDGIDNGYIQFTNVRIPRAYMLMKHSQVSREGHVTEPALQQLTYGALLSGRTAMVSDAADTAKKSLTVAVRYAAVRRQFKSSAEADMETQILDYPIHQRRLMPLLAQAVAFGFTSLEMQRLYETTSSALESLEPGDENLDDVINQLKTTHATSAGLKAFCTWACLQTIDTSRQACGGHGYSSYNGFASMYSDFAVHCTWEGDNTILALQSGRFLIQAYQEVVKGQKQSGGTAYMNNIEQVLKGKCSDKEELDTLEGIDKGWSTVAAHAVKKAAEDYEQCLKSGQSREQAFEVCSQVRFVAASVHTSGFVFRQFRAAVERVEAGAERDHLELLCKFYGLWQMEEKAAFFLRSGWLTGELLDHVQARVSEHCASTRKFAIPLIDSFAISDHILNSPIGCHDGDVYERYFDLVRRNNPQLAEHKYSDKILRFIHRAPEEMEDFEGEIDLDSELEEMAEEREEAEKEAAEAKSKQETKEDK
ncbi:putative pox1-acyl-CoA oxidase [Microstroma glucosiphilum]|uniref:Acyl-coenzyme A oxidase n=1 Tax=Pseudomicrostroma glucosiphilum TaxID=1684307 RepID=A0A316U5U5_9BASI|nr:putative pox1-acyl-CoA oxidase [Pseudomicrostroma glucosiphilum]PWN20637.1 putative pox1-acyl-CoA oxidase [Pseudomicrostroma glucosiphilum]